VTRLLCRALSSLGAIAVTLVLVPTANAAPAETAFALSGTNLLAFDPAVPETVTTKAITGVASGETLVGIDIRPQNGMLYGLGVNATDDTATLYVIGRETGFAGPVGTPGDIEMTTTAAAVIDLPTGEYGFDFNPAVDRIRVSAASGLNFRVDANTGAPVDTDANAGNGVNPDGDINGAFNSVTGSAYTNDRPNNGNVSTLYVLNSGSNQLAIQSVPNNGTETSAIGVTEGGQPLDFTASGGFDIDPAVNAPATNTPVASGIAYAALQTGATTRMYTINLVTGTATAIGTIGDGTLPVQGLALQRDLDDAGFPVVALSSDGTNLLRFQTATPGTITTQALNLAALVAGQTLVAVAWRPQTGQLWSLGIDAAANSGNLYRTDPQVGSITRLGGASTLAYTSDGATPVDLPAASSGWDIDFNPTADRIRIVAAGGFNARVNPNNGAPVDGDYGGGSLPGTNPDGVANGMSPGGVGPTAVAYTNSFPQAIAGPATTLYALDPGSNELAIQNPPNAGTLTAGKPVTEGGSALDFAAGAGLDIPAEVAVTASNSPATGNAIALLNVGGVDRLYSLDLATATATQLGVFAASLANLAVGDAQRDTPDPAPPDETPPTPTPTDGAVDGATIDLAKKLTVTGKELKVKLDAGCAEACTLTASGAVLDKSSKKRGAKAKSYAFTPASGGSAAGAKTTLTLKLKGSKTKRRKLTRKIVAAIRHQHKVTAAISVQFTDTAGNAASAGGSAKLKTKR
jgi:hypothetical protein